MRVPLTISDSTNRDSVYVEQTGKLIYLSVVLRFLKMLPNALHLFLRQRSDTANFWRQIQVRGHCDVFPSSAVEHRKNTTFVHVESLRDFRHFNLSLKIGAAKGCHKLVGQLGFLLALAIQAASLFYHVLQVILRCAEKQVQRTWIAAQRIVAMMANHQAFRNWAMRYLPSNSVGKQAFVIPFDLSITTTLTGSMPVPALVWFSFGDVAPKSVNELLGESHGRTLLVRFKEVKL